MTEIPISEIYLHIHPGYHLRGVHDPVVSLEHRQRELLWHQKAEEIAFNPQAVLFHFSAIWQQTGRAENIRLSRGGNKFYKEELDRETEYKKIIGEKRYFCFPGNTKPSKAEIIKQMNKNSLVLDEDKLSITAYGEFEDQCVKIWMLHLANQFQIPEVRYTILSELSLRTLDDPYLRTKLAALTDPTVFMRDLRLAALKKKFRWSRD